MRIKSFLILTVLTSVCAAPSFGASIYGASAVGELTGSRSVAAGEIVASGAYGQTILSWTVTPNGADWDYQYTFTGISSPAISHFILDFSDDCVDHQATCVFDEDFGGNILWDDYGQSPANPGFPLGASIVGFKFEDFAENTLLFSFTSNRAPVYGDFYIKGGSSDFAYNAGLTDHDSMNAQLFIVRPNGPHGQQVIPEPSTYVLLGTCLLVTGYLGRRRKGDNRH